MLDLDLMNLATTNEERAEANTEQTFVPFVVASSRFAKRA